MKLTRETIIIGAVGVGLAYLFFRGFKGVARDAVNAVGDTTAGVAIGIGDQIGLPSTDNAKCQAAKAAGNWWERSVYCTAPQFFGFKQ